jgi:hypothetical protein
MAAVKSVETAGVDEVQVLVQAEAQVQELVPEQAEVLWVQPHQEQAMHLAQVVVKLLVPGEVLE